MGQIRGVTALRGAAAVMVVLFHAALDARGRPGGGAFPPFLFGAAGVDVFFVLSGYVMVLSAAGAGDPMPAGRFCRRRILRIVPLYWIATLATLAHQAIANRHSALLDGWPGHLACSLLFAPCSRADLPADLPLVVQGWTLNYEMAFYGLFALALAVGGRGGVRALCAICVLAGLGAFAGLWRSGLYPDGSLLAEFALGMALALSPPPRVRAAAAVGAVLAGIALLCCAELLFAEPAASRLLAWGVPAALVVGGCSRVPNGWLPDGRAPARAALLLGDASYAIYLFHVLAFKLAGRPLLGLADGGAAARWTYFALISTSAVGLGVALHLAIERPLQAWLRPAPAQPGRVSATKALIASATRSRR